MQHRDGFAAPRHAIVIGGSMAGLLAARMLSDHFDRVTIIERDRLPDRPAFRAGVPQSRHVHILHGHGRLLLERMFPGLGADLDAAGAVRVEAPADMLWLTPLGWRSRFRPGIPGISLSRELLEWGVRRRVATLDAVRFREGCDVIGLVPSRDMTAVVGVRLRQRPGAGAGADGDGDGDGDGVAARTEELLADLVIDASGRSSQAPRWLEALGYPAPEEIRVNPFQGYASRYYAMPPAAERDWKALLIAGGRGVPRGGLIFPLEGNRWLVTLTGMAHNYPPTDEEHYLAFARGLRSPILFEAIKDAQPLSGIVGNRHSENRLRRYERLPRRPERFLVLGDAACAFNPVYGQGMTVAAKSATVLDECLKMQRRLRPDGNLAGLAGRFQRQLARSNKSAWLMTTREDLRSPATEGPKPDLAMRLMHRYMDRVLRVSTFNPTVSRVFFEVVNMLKPTSAFFRPAVLIPALLEGGRPGLTAPPTATPPALSAVAPVAEPAEARMAS